MNPFQHKLAIKTQRRWSAHRCCVICTQSYYYKYLQQMRDMRHVYPLHTVWVHFGQE